MEMTEYLQDKILALCGIISENTKTITLRILYHLKLAPTHPLIPESGKADLLPSTLLIALLQIRLVSPPLQPQTFLIRRERSETNFSPPRFRTSTGVHCHTTHPSPLHATFTLFELTTQIKKLSSDKSSGPSGITNRMLQAGDAEFQSLILLLFNGIWESHVQPTDWQLSVMQPIYKDHDKDTTDPASYSGIYPNDTLAKLFEGLLLARLIIHTATTLSPLTNLAPNPAYRLMTLFTLSSPPYNTTSIHSRNLHMWLSLTTPQPIHQCTETDCHLSFCTRTL